MNVRGGLRTFSVYFWRSEGWTSRNEALLEAVLKRTRTTKHPWLIACDANMSPEDFEKSSWFRKDQWNEEEESWKEGDRMAEQWEEEQHFGRHS